MNRRVTRRDFLRVAGMLPLSLAASRWARGLSSSGARPNVIVLVFDALSALNIRLYGYERGTMPNLQRLAQRGIVYHNHFATSNFTTSGTASLLTGTYPWTHRALPALGHIAGAVVRHNLFEALPDYHRLAYTHNAWAQIFLDQFDGSIDELVPRASLFLPSYDGSVDKLFASDEDAAQVAWTRFLKPDAGHAYSLFLSGLYEALHEHQRSQYAPLFPPGIPMTTAQEPFLLEDAVDWLDARLSKMPQPFLAYIHFLPPHAPYTTSREFSRAFEQDGLRPPEKPVDPFAETKLPDLLSERIAYDRFILYADKALGTMYDALEAAGMLQDTWLIFTSDHGEMFERGLVGHGTPALYQPAVRVPLLILEPGRQQRLDVHDYTSAVDILPTVAQLTGHAIPDWVEGRVLPPFAQPGADRALFAIQARDAKPIQPITRASTMLLRPPYKLQYYFGYKSTRGVPNFHVLHNIEADPEEMTDLSESRKGLASDMLAELRAKLDQVNLPYRRKP